MEQYDKEAQVFNVVRGHCLCYYYNINTVMRNFIN